MRAGAWRRMVAEAYALVQGQRRGERALTPVEGCATDSNFKPGLYHQAEQFVKAVNGEKSSLPSLADVTQSMELVARIYGRV